MIEYKDIGWWYWLVTAVFLSYGLSGSSIGFLLAIGLTLFQLIHFIIREKSITAFPIQVRFWYLILLLVALLEPLQLIFWIPTMGTWAQIIFGYCTMARCVSLFPWNRSEPFSLALLQKTFYQDRLKETFNKVLLLLNNVYSKVGLVFLSIVNVLNQSLLIRPHG